jgi:hypothetical protein
VNIWTEETGGRKKLRNEELHSLNSSQIIIIMIKSKRMRLAWHVARMQTKRNTHRILVGKSEGKRSLGRPRRRQVDNINMDIRKIERSGMAWIDLARDRYQWRAHVNTAMNLHVP